MLDAIPLMTQRERALFDLTVAGDPIPAHNLSRYGLMHFTRYTYPQYNPEPAHHLIAKTLDRVVSGEIGRLMIFAPPQHGKSELASVRLPAYWLGKRPNDPVIITSYGADLAYSKSRQARTIVESDEYRRIFPEISTRADSRAVNRWELAPPARGSVLAVGVGGPVTGHGAMLCVIDDPFENWAQAQSATIRQKVWEWWQGTLRTRVWEGGAIVLIMTRWHEDDLAGRLLQQQADDWHILRLPAVAEDQETRTANDKYLGVTVGMADPLDRAPGAPLCPERFSAEALAAIETDVGPLVWSAEYQGVPRPREGTWIKRAWLPIVDALPADGVRRARYWDKAYSSSAEAAHTAGVLVAVSSDGVFYIEDVVRGQWEPYDRERIIKQTAQLDAQRGHVTIYVEHEPGVGKETCAATIKNLAGFAVYADHPSGNKDVRLEPLIAQAGAGNVRLLRGTWNADYIEELVSIPSGKYRDQADATAGALNKLTLASGPLKVGVSQYA